MQVQALQVMYMSRACTMLAQQSLLTHELAQGRHSFEG